MDAAAISEIAAEKLGGWRLGVRGETRSLPRFLHAGERVFSMALGRLGTSRGRLLVATDRRLLLVYKYPLRPARCEEFPYARIRSLSATPKGGECELTLDASGETVTVRVTPAERGDEFARLLSGSGAAEHVSIQRSSSATSATCQSSPLAPLRLPLLLAAWVPLVLFWAGVLARDPALVAFLALAVAATIVEWRAGTPRPQIALRLAASVAVALLAFATTATEDSAGEGYPPGARPAFMSRCVESEAGSRSSCACRFRELRSRLGYDRYQKLGGAEVLAREDPDLARLLGSDPVESDVELIVALVQCG